jgi:hypothetical protein
MGGAANSYLPANALGFWQIRNSIYPQWLRLIEVCPYLSLVVSYLAVSRSFFLCFTAFGLMLFGYSFRRATYARLTYVLLWYILRLKVVFG